MNATAPPTLPIDHVLPDVVAALRQHNAVVLRAPAGAGKTTRVPPALLDAPLGDGRIIMLEPRRLAARTAAARIANERNSRVGDLVGYQVRFDERVSRHSRIVAITDGILLRRLQSDPFLEGIDAVLFDEFHERRLDSDLALGMVRRVQQTVRPDLKIVVMSATLDPAPIAQWLGNCPIIESQGRTFPVEIEYSRGHDRRPLPQRAAEGVARVLPGTPGDVLVFLPGVGEIRRTERELEPLARRLDLAVMPLFGDMPAEEQDQVLAPNPRRKIVLATNVAETSVTIDGITAVVDTGYARVMQFDPHVGLDRLELTPISNASADQRAGRAGRTQPGHCLRLWDEAAHRARPDYESPEIRRLDLAGPVLQLRCWGESDVLAFPWYETPAPDSIAQANRLLQRLGALSNDDVTDVGRAMVRLPVHPRLSRLLLAGVRLGIPGRAALCAALLSERDPFHRGGGPGSPATRPHVSQSDVVDRVAAFEEFEQRGQTETHLGSLNIGAARSIQRVRDQLLRLLGDEHIMDAMDSMEQPLPSGPSPRPAPLNERPPQRGERGDNDEQLMRALLAGFPDRLARRRDVGSDKGVMVGQRGVRLSPRSLVTTAELFLCIDVDGAASDAIVHQASAVERKWLPPELLRTADELFFHPSQRQVTARRRTYWDDLLLDESPAQVPQSDEAAELLFQAAVPQWDRVFPGGDDVLTTFINRVRSLSSWMPEAGLPSLDHDQLHSVLRELCRGRRSFAELQKAPWLAAVQGLLSYEQLRLLDREAPERIAVPSGNRIRLEYEPGRPPVLAVRIQEVFGLRQTPRIAAGRVPVLLHLLAPNMRPQQVTDDLESFWANTYEVVRKELKRRYPKHSWPEDPLAAEPTSRPKSSRKP